MSDSIEIRVNGDLTRVPANQTVAEILTVLGVPADRVAVELNRHIVRKNEWSNVTVSSGSEVEIVHFVGGGSN
jgi:thiamine biosynthesis protein ThiS